jgi:hypothetical protein
MSAIPSLLKERVWRKSQRGRKNFLPSRKDHSSSFPPLPPKIAYS